MKPTICIGKDVGFTYAFRPNDGDDDDDEEEDDDDLKKGSSKKRLLLQWLSY